MTTTRRLTTALMAMPTAICALALPACSSSSSTGPASGPSDAAADAGAADASDASPEAEASADPNLVPGDCVLSDGVWYCGAGYGTFPQCASVGSPTLGAPCSYDGGTCFICDSLGGGATYECGVGGWAFGSLSRASCGL